MNRLESLTKHNKISSRTIKSLPSPDNAELYLRFSLQNKKPPFRQTVLITFLAHENEIV